MSTLSKAIVTGLGTGYLPLAPGTWGSAAVVGIYVLAVLASGPAALAPLIVMAVLAVLASVGCVLLGRFAERAFGRKDPPQCTIDEWAGQAVALVAAALATPAGPGAKWVGTVAAAFVLFRLFDIVKPPPARQLEKLPGGWGVLLDDIVAGAYAGVIILVVTPALL